LIGPPLAAEFREEPEEMGVLHEKLLGDKEETKAAPEEDCLD